MSWVASYDADKGQNEDGRDTEDGGGLLEGFDDDDDDVPEPAAQRRKMELDNKCDLSSLTAEHGRLQNDIESLRAEAGALKDRVTSVDHLQVELDASKSHIARLEESLKEHSNLLDGHRKATLEVQNADSLLSDSVSVLDSQVASVQGHCHGISELERRLEKVERDGEKDCTLGTDVQDGRNQLDNVRLQVELLLRSDQEKEHTQDQIKDLKAQLKVINSNTNAKEIDVSQQIAFVKAALEKSEQRYEGFGGQMTALGSHCDAQSIQHADVEDIKKQVADMRAAKATDTTTAVQNAEATDLENATEIRELKQQITDMARTI